MQRRRRKSGGSISTAMPSCVVFVIKSAISDNRKTHSTEGLPHRVDEPFLSRCVLMASTHNADRDDSNLGSIPDDTPPETFETKSGIEIKIALGNYRMFFTPGQYSCIGCPVGAESRKETEDYFHRKRSPAEIVEMDIREETFGEGAKKRLDTMVDKRASET